MWLEVTGKIGYAKYERHVILKSQDLILNVLFFKESILWQANLLHLIFTNKSKMRFNE